jgi:hypothetical protein
LGDQRSELEEIKQQDLSALCVRPDEISSPTNYPCALEA